MNIMSQNNVKCKQICSNKCEMHNNCAVFYDVYFTELGYVKVTMCENCGRYNCNALRVSLVDGDCRPYLLAVCFSLLDGGIFFKAESPYEGCALFLPVAVAVICRYLSDRGNILPLETAVRFIR